MRNGDCITFSAGTAGLAPGDVIHIHRGGNRWATLVALLMRPRVTVVKEVTASTVTFFERRMTWAEWRQAIWRTITKGMP